MESKIIQISSAVDEQGPFIVALCEDGSVWTSDKLKSFEPFEEPFKAAQKKEEAPGTIDNKQKFQCLCEIDMLSGLGAPILQINKECPQHGHYCEA